MANTPLSLDRMDRITGSRISGVLGLSPYRTRADVMREMVREHAFAEEEFTGNFVTQYGTDHEPDAVRAYEREMGVTVENALDMQLTVVHDSLPFAVTPDGWVSEDPENATPGLLETKCPYRGTYTHWRDRPDYEAQMRLQCLVTGMDWCDMAVWRYEGTNISRLYIDRDRDGNEIDWLKQTWPEIEQFLEEYQAVLDSEELMQPYLEAILDRRVDDEWLMAEAAYWDLVAEQDRIAAELGEVKTELEHLAGNKSTKGAGLHLIRRVSRGSGGSVSYKRLAESALGADRVKELAPKFTGAGGGGGAVTWAFKRISDKEAE